MCIIQTKCVGLFNRTTGPMVVSSEIISIYVFLVFSKLKLIFSFAVNSKDVLVGEGEGLSYQSKKFG